MQRYLHNKTSQTLTRESKTVMFGYLIVISVDFHDFSADLVLIDEDNVKHSQQCLATFSNTSVHQKHPAANLVYFHLSSYYLGKCSSQTFSIMNGLIWLCLTTTGNYQILKFDWLKSIVTMI